MTFDLTADRVKQAEGLYAYMPNLPQPHNCIFTGDAGDTVHTGAVVKLDATSTSTIVPNVKVADETDDVYGVVVYDMVKDTYAVGDKVAVAQTGDSIYLVAGGAIAVGAKVEFDKATRKVKTGATQGNTLIGIAETVATADGDFIQIKLNFNLGKQA